MNHINYLFFELNDTKLFKQSFFVDSNFAILYNCDMKKSRKIIIVLVIVSILIPIIFFSGIMIYRHFNFKKALDLPVLYIYTENEKEIVSKDNYLDCEVSISNTEEFQLNREKGRVKGRGNSTWDMFEKKPYKLKFDEKVNLFGNGKAKEWTLIANHADQSLMRNYLAFQIANSFDDLKYTTSTQFVDLYINNEYRGMYLVCEQIEVGSNRVDINEDLSILDSGYLIELDFRAPDEGVNGINWFYSNNQPFVIKSPDVDDEMFSEAHVNYIKNYLDNCFYALNSSSYEQVQSLIDVNSFADSYILNELFKTNDVYQSSFYVYKDTDDKLCSGPVWDYDLSSGNCMYNNGSTIANNLYATRNSFYQRLLAYDEFKQLVKQKIEKYEEQIRNIIRNEINFVKENYAKSAERNFLKWNILGKKIWGNSQEVADIKTWKGQLNYLKSWLNNSLDYIVEVYC